MAHLVSLGSEVTVAHGLKHPFDATPGLIGLKPVVDYEEGHLFPHVLGQNFEVVDHGPVKVVGHTLQRTPGEEIPFAGEVVII